MLVSREDGMGTSSQSSYSIGGRCYRLPKRISVQIGCIGQLDHLFRVILDLSICRLSYLSRRKSGYAKFVFLGNGIP
jgi:hypothetical protein